MSAAILTLLGHVLVFAAPGLSPSEQLPSATAGRRPRDRWDTGRAPSEDDQVVLILGIFVVLGAALIVLSSRTLSPEHARYLVELDAVRAGRAAPNTTLACSGSRSHIPLPGTPPEQAVTRLT